MADDLERIKKALAADPELQYGVLAPLARGQNARWARPSQGSGAHPYAQRTQTESPVRPALPGAARDALLGLTGLMEGAAGETPAGQNLGSKETEALIGLAAPSVASRPSPSSLAANWGGKRHQRNLQTGLWHGTKGEEQAEDITRSGFQKGRSAELGISGTSLSDDPSLSLNRFSEGDPTGMLKVSPEGIDASQVFNLRPSAYAAKDYQRALPQSDSGPGPDGPQYAVFDSDKNLIGSTDDFKTAQELEKNTPGATVIGEKFSSLPGSTNDQYKTGYGMMKAPKGELAKKNKDLEGAVGQAEVDTAGESLQSLATKELKERLDEHGMVLEEVGTVNSRITTLDGETLGEGVSPLSAFLDADQKGAFDNLPSPVRMEAQSLAEKTAQGNLVAKDPKADPVEAANLYLGKSGFQLGKSGNTAYVAYDEDNEPMAMGNSVDEVVNSLAQQDLITGTDQQKIQSAIGSAQTSGAAGADPGPGAQLIAKPQSYYKESEYFAPQQTGGQSALRGRRASRPEVYRATGREPDLTNFPSDRDSAPDQLRDILTTVRESRGPRTARRESGIELAREARNYAPDEVSQAYNEVFFPRQHKQMQEIKQLAIEANDAQKEAQRMIDQGRLEAPGAELDAPVRKQVDDLFRESTRALEEMRRRAERADIPGKANARAGTRALSTVRDMLGYNAPETQKFIQNELTENSVLRRLADSAPQEARQRFRELTADFIREAGAQYSTPGALQRDLTSYVRDQGVTPLLHAIVGREPDAAVKMLKNIGGRAQLESDDPGSVID